MSDIPTDASFVKELPYAFIVVAVFVNEQGRPEMSTWGYQKPEDSQKRFERIIELSKVKKINLIMTESFMIGLYENFEQSLFTEGSGNREKVN